jgi:hypothetical protein
VLSVVFGFLKIFISIVPCVLEMFKSRYEIFLLLSSVIVNYIALCCLLKSSSINSSVILSGLYIMKMSSMYLV